MLDIMIEARQHSIGAFDVGRVLPFRRRRMVGPFIFFDRMGPHDFAAPIAHSADVRPHPHIGLSTVTYLFEGEMTHRDSLGYEQDIRPGDLNWMTAGSGIAHSERFDGMREQGGRLDGIQAWVALPEEFEETSPAFTHYDQATLPLIDDSGLTGRLIAGAAFGMKSPAAVHSPLFYVELFVKAGQHIPVPTGHAERALFVCSGQLQWQHQVYTANQMLVFAHGHVQGVQAQTDCHVLLLGGEALGPRHIWWNFVSSSKARIEQAKADWEAGRIALPPMDNGEHIPLPKV